MSWSTLTSSQRAWRVLLSLAIVAGVPALAASHIFYVSAIASTFYPYVFASVVFIHLRMRFRWMDVGGIVLLGAAFALLDQFAIHRSDTVYVVTWVSFLGMASLVVMGLNAVWLDGEERKTVLLALVPSLLILASNHYAGYLHKFTENAHPKVLDLYLYSFDASLRAPIAFWMGQVYAKWKLLGDVSFVFYVGLPFSLALVYAGQASRLRGKAIPIFVAFLLMGPIGGIFYNLFPALGPVHLFGARFPWQPLAAEQARRLFLEPVALMGLRNAIPSLHMGWTLMSWWYSRGLSDLGARDRGAVCRVHRRRDDGDRRALFHRHRCGLSVRAVFAGDVRDVAQVERFAPAVGVHVRPRRSTRLARRAAIHAAPLLVFGGDSVDPLRADDWRD